LWWSFVDFRLLVTAALVEDEHVAATTTKVAAKIIERSTHVVEFSFFFTLRAFAVAAELIPFDSATFVVAFETGLCRPLFFLVISH
jgi:hypothetical protein